ncbi:extracellular solute-binding protein [Erythrobacteraceae bacterium CFH 75059]|uniref:extracellular solute-binding protein n=1 Tax=Qipengyuania thermophila TaxID=2509361 RepID=UPI0010204551|nr:extracellular solute-binding protein [Qipengyuania thermophila]TCD06782.1 extracellular solute-binding protein [Erythrobacteraceae bacterium CFH 75059]
MRLLLASVLALFAAACSGPETTGAPADGAGEVNLYTARHYDSDQALYDRFTQLTGIRVNVLDGNADQLIARLQSEGARSPADVFITADAGTLWRAQQAGLFQPATSAQLDRLPANLREPAGNWYPFARRARIVAYNPDRVRADEVDTYEELAGPRFRGRLCVRSSDNIYNLSLMGALIEAWGEPRALDWARGIVANMARPPEGGDRDQIRAVAAGVCDVAITNSYYFIRMENGEDANDRAIASRLRLAFPSLNGQGTHVNISGGGVLANAPNKANAVRLLEFFASPEAQQHIARHNNEFPASPDVSAPAPVDRYASFTANPMPVAAFAARQPRAQALMSEAGWR